MFYSFFCGPTAQIGRSLPHYWGS